ncbi:hypothetical protein Tco_0995920 [Tanacetum coccineum]
MRGSHDLSVRSSSIASYNPSAFPKPSNGNTFSATIHSIRSCSSGTLQEKGERATTQSPATYVAGENTLNDKSSSDVALILFPENSFEVLKLLESSVEVLKIMENKFESMKILENKLESLKLQENRPVDGLVPLSIKKTHIPNSFPETVKK